MFDIVVKTVPTQYAGVWPMVKLAFMTTSDGKKFFIFLVVSLALLPSDLSSTARMDIYKQR
jgi:hypothetical protein